MREDARKAERCVQEWEWLECILDGGVGVGFNLGMWEVDE